VIKGKYQMDNKQLCAKCGVRSKAINYKKGDRTYYRSMCDRCLVAESKKKKSRWQKENYQKIHKCESCGFIPKYEPQLTVYDNSKSFKTVCLNCDVEAKMIAKIEFKRSLLKPDF
jgi:hypothetical protein